MIKLKIKTLKIQDMLNMIEHMKNLMEEKTAYLVKISVRQENSFLLLEVEYPASNPIYNAIIRKKWIEKIKKTDEHVEIASM